MDRRVDKETDTHHQTNDSSLNKHTWTQVGRWQNGVNFEMTRLFKVRRLKYRVCLRLATFNMYLIEKHKYIRERGDLRWNIASKRREDIIHVLI